MSYKYKAITAALMLVGLSWTAAFAADAPKTEAEAAKPTETKPADVKPTEVAKPVETKPADAKPTEVAKPTEPAKTGKHVAVSEGLKACNKTSTTLYAALAYSTDDADKQWVSQGWTEIKASDCEMLVNEKLSKHFYYIYAMSENGDITISGDDVNHTFCVDAEADNFKFDGGKCAHDKKKFIEIEVKEALQSFDLKLK